jgi:N-succinyldiaminopimelate aminotransferase
VLNHVRDRGYCDGDVIGGDHEKMTAMSQRVAGFGTTIFSDINALARQHNAVNLGQGAPDFDGPPVVLAAAVEAVNGALNQYAPGIGMANVRTAIAQHAGRFYGQHLDPESEVLVTTGATEGILRQSSVLPTLATR